MKVEIVDRAEFPLTTCSMAAGCCYGKENISERRLVSCLNSGHFSVFEHAVATWRVEGISRACSHQLVRHRVASYSQQSQRYCKIDVDNDDWYVVPPEVENKLFKDVEFEFRKQMGFAAQTYLDLLDMGVKPEDARYVLPAACKTDIYITMNFRELMHFFDLRMDKAAQWEIQALAGEMYLTLRDTSDEWATLLNMYHGHASHMTWGRP